MVGVPEVGRVATGTLTLQVLVEALPTKTQTEKKPFMNWTK